MIVDAQQFERLSGERNKNRDNLGSSEKAATSYQWFALYSMSYGAIVVDAQQFERVSGERHSQGSRQFGEL
jgi:hypothetical protein